MLIEMGHVLSRHLNISNFLVQIIETLKKKKRIVSREHHLRTMLFQTHSDTQIHFFITVID